MLISMPQQISSNFGVVQSMMLTSLVRYTHKDVDDGTFAPPFLFHPRAHGPPWLDGTISKMAAERHKNFSGTGGPRLETRGRQGPRPRLRGYSTWDRAGFPAAARVVSCPQ